MSTIISAISSLVTAAVSWLSIFAQTIIGYTPASGSGSSAVAASYTPNILTLFVLIPVVGLGVGLLRRLMKT